jgi:hypothetical protein
MNKQAVEVVEPEVLAPVEASWDRARQLVAEIGDWHKIIELGRVLQALRENFFRVGQGCRTDLRPRADEGSQVVDKPSETGWRAVVRRELGMSHQTALRAIDRGLYVQKVACLMAGEELEYETTRGEWHKLAPTPEVREKAKEVMNDILAGANAGNAWAGFVGEVTRRGRHGTPNRAPVDHLRNLQTALTKLENSLKAWRRLKPDERALIEKQWSDRVLKLIPGTWER